VDVAGALNAGIDAVWYQPNPEAQRRAGEIHLKSGQSVYTIQSLDELKQIL
jgi:FMN phosphatase YigB (HAD superfamily)